MTSKHTRILAALAIPLLLFYFSSCKKENPDPGFIAGRNDFTINVDGASRKYVVHVPKGYTGNDKVPMVIMCHGTGQDGSLFYNISGWKEVGDSLNILTVYPSSLEYCVIDEGVTETTTKWHSLPESGYSFCDGQDIKDDVKFMREMIAALESKYNIDSKRVYMVGFSNGGEFTATCAISMSDILAAAISSGGGGAMPRDTVYTPARLLPVMLMFGSRDQKLVRAAGLPEGSSMPMGFDALYTQFPFLYAIQPKPYINTFQLDENNYTLSGDTNSVVTADYHGLSGQPNNVFKLVEVKGLEHEYPNGKNYPLNAAIFHWNWFKEFSLP